MARLVRREATGPIEVKPQEKSVWICACGLSQNQPFCDGSHKKTKAEKPGEVHVYGAKCDTAIRVDKE
jgi:CDGSH-type Zn-finger protein